MRKKAFRRAKARRRLIAALIAWVLTVIIVSGAVFMFYKIARYFLDDNEVKATYVEAPYDDRQIVLVENYISRFNGDDEHFFDVVEKEDAEVDLNIKDDPDAYKYIGVTPGSKGLVIVDAGHGGNDGGAVANNVTEKVVNLAIALKLQEELTKRGYTVLMTRTTDEYVGLTARASFANRQDNPVCLVSVHQNSIDESSAVNGVEAWTYKRSGCTELGDAVTEAVANRTGAPNRGTHYRTNLVVTSKTTMPAIIVECSYLTNPGEAEKIASDDYQTLVAKGIADGVDAFAGN